MGMARSARVVLENYPHHVIQRGHNKQVVFATREDYLFYLDNLREWKETLGCKIYAFCLMQNHVHLLVDPGIQRDNLGVLMKRVAGRQTRHVNKLEHRTGTLWEGRYKSSPVSTNEYLLACCRYIELNPVRAGIVADPEDYPWSSYRLKVNPDPAVWIDLDPLFLELGQNEKERVKKYRDWVKDSIPEEEWSWIRQAVQRGQLTGSGSFVDEVAQKIKRRIELRGQGRPTKRQK
jgi:putative transposase